MNYLQALFSIFNAPLFATFIIGMFWKRMTPAAGFWGLVAGTVAAAVDVHRLQGRAGSTFGSDLDESMLGRGRWRSSSTPSSPSLVTLLTQPKPVEELQGLVTAWPTSTRAPRKPQVVGVAAAAGLQRARRRAVLTIVFW